MAPGVAASRLSASSRIALLTRMQQCSASQWAASLRCHTVRRHFLGASGALAAAGSTLRAALPKGEAPPVAAA